jgi:hypothetical protein
MIYNLKMPLFTVLLLVILQSRQLGMPQEICELYANTLSKLKFYIKTTWGISDEFYIDEPENARPVHGAGQGAGEHG